jgi:zinc protease
MGDIDKGLFVISGKLPDGVSMQDAENGILEEIRKISTILVDEKELQKCKNKVESTLTFSETDVLTKATNLAVSELLGDAALINEEVERYAAVTREMIREQAANIFKEENCSTLYYLAKK